MKQNLKRMDPKEYEVQPRAHYVEYTLMETFLQTVDFPSPDPGLGTNHTQAPVFTKKKIHY